jgi:hypothetical protein
VNKSIVFLRIAYWIGIIADAYMAIKLLLIPYNSNLPFSPEMETVSSLMIGWTILLIWADRKPIERRAILLLTIMMIIGRISILVVVLANKISLNEALINDVPPIIVVSCFIILYAIAEIELRKGIVKTISDKSIIKS